MSRSYRCWCWWWWWLIMVMIVMIIMHCFCGMVDQRIALILIFNRDLCPRFSLSQISDTLPAGLEPTQNMSPSFDKWYSANVISTTPRCLEEPLLSTPSRVICAWVHQLTTVFLSNSQSKCLRLDLKSSSFVTICLPTLFKTYQSQRFKNSLKKWHLKQSTWDSQEK